MSKTLGALGQTMSSVSNAPTRRAMLRLGGSMGLVAWMPGCGTPVRGPSVPRHLITKASVLGLKNERFFPASGSEALETEFSDAANRLRRSRGLMSSAPLPPIQLLSISGGGENGAFGAGLLCGWSEHASRPIFHLVTGVSTGALTAPFAYLGPDYDPQLRNVYTGISAKDVLVRRNFTSALFDDALADNAPLFGLISKYLNADMLSALARAYDEGRLLLVASADLDAQQPVIWNIGAIARSGHPKALEIIRKVLLASSAIPGAFPPTMIDVTAEGRQYQEMHVDGGAFAQAFLYPTQLLQGRRKRTRRDSSASSATAYIVRNGRLDPEWSKVERQTLSIVGRAISTMIAASGYNDVLRMYNNTLRDGIKYNLAYIGSDFSESPPEPFDQQYMRSLFDYGFQLARNGYPWANKPPLT